MYFQVLHVAASRNLLERFGQSKAFHVVTESHMRDCDIFNTTKSPIHRGGVHPRCEHLPALLLPFTIASDTIPIGRQSEWLFRCEPIEKNLHVKYRLDGFGSVEASGRDFSGAGGRTF